MSEDVFGRGSGYLAQAETALGTSLDISTMSGVGSIVGAVIDYGMLKNQKSFAENQARLIQVQAEQRSNQLLEQFNASIANAQYGAARRGVRAGEGSVKANIELSAKDLGEDIQTSKKSASLKAQQVRSQAQMDYGSGVSQSLLSAGTGFLKSYESLGNKKILTSGTEEEKIKLLEDLY